MGEIRVPCSGNATSHWSDYMAKLLREAVRDWANRVESGNLKEFYNSDKGPITAEHLRIAKDFLNGVYVD